MVALLALWRAAPNSGPSLVAVVTSLGERGGKEGKRGDRRKDKREEKEMHPIELRSKKLHAVHTCMYIQWHLSIKDTPNEGHLSNEDTVCSHNHIELCTNLPLH